MEKDLHKRLEEAEVTIRTEIINGIPHAWLSTAIDKATRQGFELGYKEVIAQAKEWMLNNVYKYAGISGIFFRKSMLVDFEADMTKLLEKQK